MTISLCMIVKNEEDVLARCLDSAAGLADEIIITDTGSSDRTVDIALQYTDQVFTFPWVNDFAAARNAGIARARMDFILWLDADDVIPPASLEALLALKKGLTPDVSMVMLPYHTAFDPSGQPGLIFYRERLFRNHQGFFFQGAVHEAVTPRGHVIRREIPIEHRKTRPGAPGRNLAILRARQAAGLKLEPRQQYYLGRELFDHERYGEAARALAAFLDQGQGWEENNIEACYLLSQCYSLLGEDQPALEALFQSFAHGLPRPEGLCRIGEWFLAHDRLPEAVYWYEQALACPAPEPGGFTQPDFEGYLPCLQLCLCHDRLGQWEQAAAYNRRAWALRPDSPICRRNDAYFKSRLEGAPS